MKHITYVTPCILIHINYLLLIVVDIFNLRYRIFPNRRAPPFFRKFLFYYLFIIQAIQSLFVIKGCLFFPNRLQTIHKIQLVSYKIPLISSHWCYFSFWYPFLWRKSSKHYENRIFNRQKRNSLQIRSHIGAILVHLLTCACVLPPSEEFMYGWILVP